MRRLIRFFGVHFIAMLFVFHFSENNPLIAQTNGGGAEAQDKTGVQKAILANPLLQEAFSKNEDEMVAIIDILKEIASDPKNKQLILRGRSRPKRSENLDSDLAKILNKNPAIKSAYEANAKKTLLQINRIVEIIRKP